MKITTISSAAAILALAACAAPEEAAAAELSGTIEFDVAETASGKIANTTTFGLDVNAAQGMMGHIELDTDGAGALSIDEWHAGVAGDMASVSLGKQGNVWVDGPSAAAHSTLLDPAMGETVKVSAAGASVAVELDNPSTDVFDLGSIQGAYTMDIAMVTATGAVDYDTNTENLTWGGRGEAAYGVAAIGGTMTYSKEADWAYEADATVFGVTAYLNGDKTDAMQNVGGVMTQEIAAGVALESSVNYNFDNEDIAPAVNLTFAF